MNALLAVSGPAGAASAAPKLVLNVGAGPAGNPRVRETFPEPAWREIRLDIDRQVRPDIVATFSSLALGTATMDAVWSSHSLEHLFAHEVPPAIAEVWRVLKPGGTFIVAVPDLQLLGAIIGEGRLEEPLYESSMGPITARDIVFGHQESIARGLVHMAHKTGFTPLLLGRLLVEAGFGPVVLRRQPHFELLAMATKPSGTPADGIDPPLAGLDEALAG